MKTTEYVVSGGYQTKMDKPKAFFVRMEAESLDVVIECALKIKDDKRRCNHDFEISWAGPWADYGSEKHDEYETSIRG